MSNSQIVVRVLDELEFFVEEVCSTHLPVSDDAISYLSLTMSQWVRQSRLPEKPLGILMLEGLQTSHGSLRRQILKSVGDASLFLTGMYWSSLSNRLVDVDYFRKLGQIAYGSIDEDLFTELSEEYQVIADAITEVGLKWLIVKNTDLMRMYEVWMKTGNSAIRKLLEEKGVRLPITRVETKRQ